jgi:RNA polymerase sigma-70 factor (ECF subfamily)
MRDITLSDIERLRAEADTTEIPLEMDEEAFSGFYDRTARVLRGYLARITGDSQLADDLLQEAYYRFLRARSGYESEAHRRNALFRIATNLARDGYRRAKYVSPAPVEPEMLVDDRHDPAALAEQRTDLRKAMRQLRPRDREILWLAYAQGSTHREIAAALGLRTGSIKLMLFRARRRLAALLRTPVMLDADAGLDPREGSRS